MGMTANGQNIYRKLVKGHLEENPEMTSSSTPSIEQQIHLYPRNQCNDDQNQTTLDNLIDT